MKEKYKKNSFEKMCDELDREYIFDENEITYVKKYLIRQIGNDKDLLMKLQAQAQADDTWQYLAVKVSIVAMFCSALSVILQLIPKIEFLWLDGIIKLFYLGILLFVVLKFGTPKYKSVRRWREYVLAAIQDRIKDLKE